ncbi:MAG: hypothetical protein ABIZ18_15780, partial [Caldimonas sp.]
MILAELELPTRWRHRMSRKRPVGKFDGAVGSIAAPALRMDISGRKRTRRLLDINAQAHLATSSSTLAARVLSC